MKTILNARLVWIYALESKKNKLIEDYEPTSSFLSLINSGDRSEYTPAYYEQIRRKELINDSIMVDDCEIKLTVVENEYSKYKCNLIHIYAEISSKSGVCVKQFAKLISGSGILEQRLIKANSSIKEELDKLQTVIKGTSFLINQIRETIPPLPKDILTDSKSFTQNNIEPITQFLLRSDTEARFISSDNHQDYLVNTSSFKGSVELCSANTMIQFYFSDLESLSDQKIINADVRLSWMCSVITMVNIQSMILKNALTSLNDIGELDANNKITKTKELKNILVGLKEYWDVDAMIHPMTARKVNIYKGRMGVINLFNTLNFRMESTENLALRELSEIQNEQDQTLNYILLLIASIQIVPLVYQIVTKFSTASYQIEFVNYGSTMFISIFLPLLILKIKSIRRRVNSAFIRKMP